MRGIVVLSRMLVIGNVTMGRCLRRKIIKPHSTARQMITKMKKMVSQAPSPLKSP